LVLGLNTGTFLSAVNANLRMSLRIVSRWMHGYVRFIIWMAQTCANTPCEWIQLLK